MTKCIDCEMMFLLDWGEETGRCLSYQYFSFNLRVCFPREFLLNGTKVYAMFCGIKKLTASRRFRLLYSRRRRPRRLHRRMLRRLSLHY